MIFRFFFVFVFSIPCVAIPFRMFSQMLFCLQVTKSTFICLEASKSRIFTTGWPTRQNMSSTQPTTYRVVCCGKMLAFGAFTVLMRKEGGAVSVSSDRRVGMWLNFLEPKLTNPGYWGEWFQQDGSVGGGGVPRTQWDQWRFWDSCFQATSPYEMMFDGLHAHPILPHTNIFSGDTWKAAIYQLQKYHWKMIRQLMENFRNWQQQRINNRDRHLENIIFKR